MKWKIRFTAQYLFSMRIQRFLMKTYLSCTYMYKCFEPIPFSYYNRNLIIRLIQCKSWTMIKINLTFYLYRQCTLFSFWNTLKLFVFRKSMFVYFYIHVYAVYLHKSNWCIFIFVKMLTCIYKQRLHFYLLHRCTFQTEVMWNKINFNSFPF